MISVKKWGKMLSFILCFALIFNLALCQPAYAGLLDWDDVQSVLERGVSFLFFGIASFIVMFLNAFNISTQQMISQGADPANSSNTGKAFDLTTIRIDDSSGRITGLFDAIIHQYYPPLIKLAMIVFMLGIIYIGILTLFSTSSGRRAEYMEKLKAWGMGLLLLFAFNFVMVYVIKANNYLASFFLDISGVYGDSEDDDDEEEDDNYDDDSPTEIANDPDHPRNYLKYINEYRAANKTGGVDYSYTNSKGEEIKFTIKRISLYQHEDEGNWLGIDEFCGQEGNHQLRLLTNFVAGDYGKVETYPDKTYYMNGTVKIYKYEKCVANPEEKSPDAFWAAPYDWGYLVTNPMGSGDYHRWIFLKTEAGIDKNSGNAGNDYKFNKTSDKLTTEDVYNVYEEDGDKVRSTGIKELVVYSTKNEGTNADKVVEPEDPILLAIYQDYMNSNGPIGDSIVYLIAALQTLWFFLIYFTRMFIVSFLILIFPLVMAVYCIDRLNDNKSAVFGEWWKQFTANVFTNSVHALTYGIIFSVILSDKEYNGIIKVIALFFLVPANNLARQVFGLGRGAMADLGAFSAMAAGGLLASRAMSGGKGKESTASSQGGGSGGGGGGSGGGGGGGGKAAAVPMTRLEKFRDFGKKWAPKAAAAAGATTAALGVLGTGGSARNALEMGYVGGTIGSGMVSAAGKGASKVYQTGRDLPLNLRKKKVARRARKAAKNGEDVEVVRSVNNGKMSEKLVNSKTGQDMEGYSWEQEGDFSAINPSDKSLEFRFSADEYGGIKDDMISASESRLNEVIDEQCKDEDNKIDSEVSNFNSAGYFNTLGVGKIDKTMIQDDTSRKDLIRRINDGSASDDDKSAAREQIMKITNAVRARDTKATRVRENVTGNGYAMAGGLIRENYSSMKGRTRVQRQQRYNPIIKSVEDA